MESIVETFTSSPIFLVGGAVLAIVLVFFILKKLVKMAIILVVLGIGFVAYLYFTGENPVEFIEENIKTGKDKLGEIDKATKDLREDLDIDQIIKDVEKQMKDK